jgi:hypothetical protein
MLTDLRSSIRRAFSLKPAARNASATGAAVDNAGVYAGIRRAFVLILGLWTDGTHTFKLQESEDNSTWSDIAVTDLEADPSGIPTIDGTTGYVVVDGLTKDEQIVVVNYLGGKRYLRAVQTVASATTGLVAGVSVETTGLRADGGPNPMKSSAAF